jgi:hypothetical protein
LIAIKGVLNGKETKGSNGGGVNPVLHYALKVRIEEGGVGDGEKRPAAVLAVMQGRGARGGMRS